MDGDTGKRKQVTRSGFRTRDEAEAELTETLAALNSGVWTDDKGTTVGEWLDQWLAETEERGASPKTLANYRGHVRDLWLPQLGRLKLRDLRRAHIEKALSTLSAPMKDRGSGNVGRRIEKRSASTIDGYRRTVRAALSAAQRRGLITANPAVGRLDSIPKGTTQELSIWQPQQTATFLEHVRADRLSALYELAAYAGLRRGELCGLRWKDLDDDQLGLRVRQTVVEVSSSQVKTEEAVCATCGQSTSADCSRSPKAARGVGGYPCRPLPELPCSPIAGSNRSSETSSEPTTATTTSCSATSMARPCGRGPSLARGFHAA